MNQPQDKFYTELTALNNITDNSYDPSLPITQLLKKASKHLVNPIELIDESHCMPGCTPVRQQAIEILDSPIKRNKAIEILDAPSDVYTQEAYSRKDTIRELPNAILVGAACDESFKHDAENFFNTLQNKSLFYSKFVDKEISSRGLVPNPRTAEPYHSENKNLDASQGSPVTVVTEEDGMYTQEIRDKKLHKNLICNFTLFPYKKFCIFKGNKLDKSGIIVSLKCGNLVRETSIFVETKNIDSIGKTITNKYSECCISPQVPKAHQLIANELRQNSQGLPEQCTYTNIGWTKIKGQNVYLHDGLNGIWGPDIIFDSKKALIANRGISKTEAIKNAFKVLHISKDIGKILPLFLFVHLALMTTLFSDAGFRPTFILFIAGKTGSLKTAVSKALFSIFEDGKNKITATFKDTVASLEIKMDEARDSILLVDDYHPAATTKQKAHLDEVLENIVRFYGDGIGKDRSNPHMEKQKKFEPTGLCAITGEDIGGTQSSLLRCLLVSIQKDSYNSEVLTMFQENPTLWTTHLVNFVEYVGTNYESMVSRIRQNFPKRRECYRPYFKAKRLADTVAWLMETSSILLEYCIHYKFMSGNDASLLFKQWEEVIKSVAKSSEYESTSVDPEVLYLYAIKKLSDIKKFPIAISQEEYGKDPNSYYGFKKDDSYFLEPDATYKAVCNYFSTIKRNFNFSSKVIYDGLYAKNAIIPQIENRKDSQKVNRLYKTTLPGRPRFLRLVPDKLTEIPKEEGPY